MTMSLIGHRTIRCLLALSAALAMWVPTSLAEAHIDANARALAQLDDDWSKAAASRDAERVASFYAEDAIAYPPSEPMAVGKAAAKKVWATYFSDPSFAISWKTMHAEVNGELGYTSGTYSNSFAGPDGK